MSFQMRLYKAFDIYSSCLHPDSNTTTVKSLGFDHLFYNNEKNGMRYDGNTHYCIQHNRHMHKVQSQQ